VPVPSKDLKEFSQKMLSCNASDLQTITSRFKMVKRLITNEKRDGRSDIKAG
jgi:transcription initiation factor TFIID subunit TAF12